MASDLSSMITGVRGLPMKNENMWLSRVWFRVGVYLALCGVMPGLFPTQVFAQDAAEPTIIVKDVQVVGNQYIPTERILSRIATKPGRPYDKKIIQQDVRNLFGTHWFYDVVIEEQPESDGSIFIFRVIERPTITEIRYIGNDGMDDDDLREITGLKVGDAMDEGLNKSMAQRIERKYHEKGYPFATVELLEGRRGDSRVIMRITEGPKTKVKKVSFEGHSFVSGPRLKTKIGSRAAFLGVLGGKYNPEKIDEDISQLIEYYRAFGYLDVRVGRRLEWTEDKSGVNLIYVVEEGPQYEVRDVQIAGNKIFEQTELAQDLQLTAGKTFDQRTLNGDSSKLQNHYGSKGYIHTVVNADVRYLDEPGKVDVVYQVQEDVPHRVGEVKIIGNEVTKDRVILGYMKQNPGDIANTVDLAKSEQALRETRLFEVNPQEQIAPTVTFDPANDPRDEFQDILVRVQEAQTGSLMFGVGVNSDSGVGGSLVLNERNFDIFGWPSGMSDLRNAFRGAGQELRIEAVPGNQVQRYAVTFREPRLFGLDYSLSTSIYYFRRIYSNYNEGRTGMRTTLGKRFTRTIGASLTYRIEGIEVFNPSVPTPPDLEEVLGNNFLTSFRGAIDHDTRDSALNSTSGHFAEISFEQALGDYNYPRFGVDARQFWSFFKRGDGSGAHVLTAHGELGWSGSDTPMFERFYAGGFRSLRGFSFRGVSPTVDGSEVGGDFLMLTSLEYQFPLTADDNLGWVFFTDAGTVEPDLEINDYRVSVGFGLRVKLPQMGPAPLAFDFGFPLVDKSTDDRQLFSFFIGFFR